MNMKTCCIQSDRLIIKPFVEDLLTTRYVGWLNDPFVVANSRQRHRQHTLADCRAYFLSFSNTDHAFLSIQLNTVNLLHIGNITVTVDHLNRVADVALLIGDRRYWSQGYGLESWKAVLHFLIKDQGFRKITGGCYSTNRAMERIMMKTGMQYDGRRKDQVLVDGKPADLVYYALFNHDVAIA